jgi:hypothetical protein
MSTYYGTDKDRLTALVTATNKVLERPTPATPTPVDVEAQREEDARRLVALRNPPRGR